MERIQAKRGVGTQVRFVPNTVGGLGGSTTQANKIVI